VVSKIFLDSLSHVLLVFLCVAVVVCYIFTTTHAHTPAYAHTLI